MNLSIIIPVAIGIVLLVWYILEKIKSYSMKAFYIKIATSLCFIATALCSLSNYSGHSLPYALLILGGLIFGLIGDIVLDLKYIDRDREDLHTRSGFIAFGIGHVLFMIAMFIEFGQFITPSALFVVISLVAGFGAGYVTAKNGKLFGNDYGEYFNIVAAYCGILASATIMAVLYCVLYALAPSFRNPQPALYLMAIGLICFLISDLILSRSYFGEGHHKPADIIPNYIFYYGAQFLIALSIASVLR